MSLSVGAGVMVQPVITSVTAPHTGLTSDALAEMLVNKVIFVGPGVPAPIRLQALAYRERLIVAAQYYLAQAQRSERTTMIGILEQAGEFEAAKLLRDF